MGISLRAIFMSWTYLFAAVILDVAATVTLKYSSGLTRPYVAVLAFLLFGISVAAVGLALRDIPLLAVYTVWLGTGIALVAIIGGIWFDEALSPAGWVSISAILLGVIGLSLSNTPTEPSVEGQGIASGVEGVPRFDVERESGIPRQVGELRMVAGEFELPR